MIKYVLFQNKSDIVGAKGKWYARQVSDETIDVKGLAQKIHDENSVYSLGTIQGLLTDMVTKIKTLILDGKSVRLDDLGILSAGIVNVKNGAETKKDFSAAKNVSGIKVNFLSSGDMRKDRLSSLANLKEAHGYVSADMEQSDVTPGEVSGDGKGTGGSTGTGGTTGAGGTTGTGGTSTGSGSSSGDGGIDA